MLRRKNGVAVTLLVLAGAGEAQQIGHALVGRGIDAEMSYAGGGRAMPQTGLPTRRGGFGGEAGFRAYLEAHHITAVLDATHPFAHRITGRTARICKARGLPYCQLLRAEWTPEVGDRWVFLDRVEDAADHIPQGAVVFLTTGRATLKGLANLQGRQLICRQIDPPEEEFPLPNGRYLTGTPPFSVEDEVALFRQLGVDWLIVKNDGGEAPRSKLIAARRLGLPVAVLNRPPQPDAFRVKTVDAALEWVESL